MKEEIVREYLNKGKLLTPDALRALETGAMGQAAGIFISEAPESSPARSSSVQVLRTLPSHQQPLTPDDFVGAYRRRYEALKTLIAERVPKAFVSLNKPDTYREEVHVIGLVRERKAADDAVILFLDDSTATVPIRFETDPGAAVGDVVAVRAVSAKAVLFGKDLLYPDIPLRQPTLGYGSLCVAADLHLDEAPLVDVKKFFLWFARSDIPILVLTGDIGDPEILDDYLEQFCSGKTVIVAPGEKDGDYPQAMTLSAKCAIAVSSPALLNINGLVVLIAHHFTDDMLKKRLVPGETPLGDLVLDTAPDVVLHGHRNEPSIKHYKAATIVTAGSVMAHSAPVVINLGTRETEFAAVE